MIINYLAPIGLVIIWLVWQLFSKKLSGELKNNFLHNSFKGKIYFISMIGFQLIEIGIAVIEIIRRAPSGLGDATLPVVYGGYSLFSLNLTIVFAIDVLIFFIILHFLSGRLYFGYIVILYYFLSTPVFRNEIFALKFSPRSFTTQSYDFVIKWAPSSGFALNEIFLVLTIMSLMYLRFLRKKKRESLVSSGDV